MRKIEFANTVKKIRIEKGFSQEDLSDKAELSLRTIQRIESGKSEPRGDTLRRLSKGLELPDNYFNQILFNDEHINKKRFLSWYVIGFFIIGGSSGFILSLILANMDVLPANEFGVPLLIGITTLFSGIGIAVGNYLENRNY